MKMGSRDLAVAVAGLRTGGTTVSATCELAAAAGIAVFATGGIGGVHRGVAEHLDVSQDLAAIARFPVAVVCAGAKSVLDLPKTLEVLEALAVPVIGVGTYELPGFYTRATGLRLEHRIEGRGRGGEARAQPGSIRLGRAGCCSRCLLPQESALPRAWSSGTSRPRCASPRARESAARRYAVPPRAARSSAPRARASPRTWRCSRTTPASPASWPASTRNQAAGGCYFAQPFLPSRARGSLGSSFSAAANSVRRRGSRLSGEHRAQQRVRGGELRPLLERLLRARPAPSRGCPP